MADAPNHADAGTVTDGRVPAKGLLPKYLLLWIIFGLALVLTIASVVTNLRVPRSTPGVLAERPSADNPKRIDDFGTQLEADAERQRLLAEAKPPKTIGETTKKPLTSRQGGGGSGVDAEATRERERLAANTMVVSRRPVAEADAGRLGGRSDLTGTPPPDATTDDIVASILKAKGALSPAPLPGATTAPAPGGEPQKDKGPVRRPPISAAGPLHLLLESTALDATLWQPLEGSNESPVKAIISGPVFSHNRQFVLIPEGTFALGTARAVQNYHESRLAVAFHRLEFPDGSTVSFDQNPGLDQAGDVGLHDKVNNHYLATFGRAAAVGVLQGLGQWVGYRGFGGGGSNSPVIIAGDVGQSTSSAFNSILNKMPLPTVEIRAGHRLKIYLTSDIELPAWSRVGEVRPIR